MTLKDLPDEIQHMALAVSNRIVRDLEGQPIELIDLLDKAVVHGMELEANRQNSKCENLAQTLTAFRNFIIVMMPPDIDISTFVSLVD